MPMKKININKYIPSIFKLLFVILVTFLVFFITGDVIHCDDGIIPVSQSYDYEGLIPVNESHYNDGLIPVNQYYNAPNS